MTIKTAISIDAELFEKAESMARTLHITRSGLFVLALKEYLRRHEDMEMYDTLNDVYRDGPDTAERVAHMNTFLDTLADAPTSGLTREEIQCHLNQERQSWENRRD